MDQASASFVATALGAAVGVVAGIFVQWGVAALGDKARRRARLADVRAEAVYNISVLEQLISECAKLRASAQPGAIANYFGTFRFTDFLWIAMNQMVASGSLYRSFSHDQIGQIQKMMLFCGGPQGQFVINKINEIKQAQNISEAINFSNYIEAECQKYLPTLRMLEAKTH